VGCVSLFASYPIIIQEQAYMINPFTRRWPLLYRLAVYLLAVITAYVLASITATQSVISSLSSMGIDVDLATRLSMTVKDLAGMAGSFLPMIAAGYLVAFLVVGLLLFWRPQWRTPLYLMAGGVALIAIHLTLQLAFSITPVAIGRTVGGLLVQGVAGAVGGYVFSRLMQRA
jgi:hypothetical protein